MKPILFLRLAACGMVALFTQTTLAQTWQTVDDFQYAAGTNSFATGLAKDPSGNIYVAGDGEDAAGNVYVVGAANTPIPSTNYWVVRKGIPDGAGGIAWSTVSATVGTVFLTEQSDTSAIYCHPTAGIFVAGHSTGTGGAKGTVA